MPKKPLLALALTALVCSAVPAAVAHEGHDSAPPTGVKAETKLTQLAEAMPESKYAWRPGKEVRSPGEVFMHVAAANFGLPSFWGAKPPEGFDFRTYEKSLTKKADIQQALAGSFVYLRRQIEDLSDADMEKPVEMFGNKTTARGAALMLVSHNHEHLGQSIAYARMNKVTPPWSAAQAASPKKSEH
jgi:hypothetical protein